MILLFLFLSFFTFYLPGFLLVKKTFKELRKDETVVLSYALGLITFFILAFVFASLQIRFMVPLSLIALDLITIKKFKGKTVEPLLLLLKDKVLFLALFVCTLIEGFINFPNGLLYKEGHLYWSAQGHDGLWHVAVIEAMKKNFPPDNPLYAGEKLYNYHYFTDVITAEFNKIFSFFNTIDLYFRDFSFLIAFLMGLAVFSFLLTWTKEKLVGYLGIFFLYLVGSFGYIVLAIQHKGFFGGEATFWAAQNNTIIGNPPHAFSFILISAFLITFYYFLQSQNKINLKDIKKSLAKENRWILMTLLILGGFLVGFKVSGAFVLLAGLSVAAFFEIIIKRNFRIAFLVALLGLSNLIMFKTITRGGGSFLIFEPWYFVRSMIVSFDRVDWIDLELRRQFYMARGGIRGFLRVTEYELIAFFLFFAGNLGIRIIGLFEIGQRFIKRTIFNDSLALVIFFAGLTGFLMPIFFVQKGVAYIMIQFMQYFFLFFGFFAAISLFKFLKLFKNNLVKIAVFTIFFCLGVPTIIGNLWEFYGKNPLAKVTNEELAGLNYLKQNAPKDSVILTKPFNQFSKGLYKNQPWPIYAWDSTAYVPAYTARQSYLTNDGQVRNLGINPEERLKKAHAFFDYGPSYGKEGQFLRYDDNFGIPEDIRINFLKEEKIDYVFVRQEEVSPQNREFFEKIGLKKVFENSDVVVYETNEVKGN